MLRHFVFDMLKNVIKRLHAHAEVPEESTWILSIRQTNTDKFTISGPSPQNFMDPVPSEMYTGQ
jgi:hypothetical protein